MHSDVLILKLWNLWFKVENRRYCYLLQSHLTSSLGVNHFEFRDEPDICKIWSVTRSHCRIVSARVNDHVVLTSANGICHIELAEQQTMKHDVDMCLIRKFDGGLMRLHKAGDDSVDWLFSLVTPEHCNAAPPSHTNYTVSQKKPDT